MLTTISYWLSQFCEKIVLTTNPTPRAMPLSRYWLYSSVA